MCIYIDNINKYEIYIIQNMERDFVDLTNDYDNDYDYDIRPPDEVRRERLISWDYEHTLRDTITETMPLHREYETHKELNDDELEKVLMESMMNYDNEMEKFCKEIYEAEQKVRQGRFANVRRVIERICRIDKANTREYNMLLDAFTMYENGYFEHYVVQDEMLYTRIMYILKSLRITKGEYDDLVRFIVA